LIYHKKAVNKRELQIEDVNWAVKRPKHKEVKRRRKSFDSVHDEPFGMLRTSKDIKKRRGPV
jgi:hypothetical protein